MRARFLIVGSLLAAALALPRAAAAQQFPPDSLVNLVVLPQTMTVRQVLGVMGGFTRALGVRCNYCHVGEEGKPLSTYDFASDEKATKVEARVMLRMVNAINDRYLSSLDERATPPVHVECSTCHRGVKLPRSLAATLQDAYDAGGLDSLRAEYKTLRADYYGRASYDFGPGTLADVANGLLATHPADAIQVHLLNTQVNADSPEAWSALGGAYARTKDNAKAIEAFQKALQLDPNDGRVKMMLNRLRGGGGGGGR